MDELEFQRITISGEEKSGVPLADLTEASTHLIEALRMRKKYMELSQQTFHPTADRFLSTVDGTTAAAPQTVITRLVVLSNRGSGLLAPGTGCHSLRLVVIPYKQLIISIKPP